MAEQPTSKVCHVTEPATPVPYIPGNNNQEAEQDYDFVEEPDQDYFCPVSLELLLEPCQTSCCGHHISQHVASRLARDGKPCPMCKKDNFATHEDLYFKRKIRQLKVCCVHKKNGCEWVGELGDLDHHSMSCPKRPWKCKHCNFESTYEKGPNEHAPNCAQQFVECEFASMGCDVMVSRRDLAKHMTENAQQHLMSATLLNLQLTRELHQKMEEKDQQIAELKQQLKQQETTIAEMSGQTTATIEKQVSRIGNEIQQQLAELSIDHQQPSDFQGTFQQVTQYQHTHIASLIGFTSHKFSLTDFKRCQAKGLGGSWYGDPFYTYSGGYRFKLCINTNGCGNAYRTHLSAFLFLLKGDHDEKLQWPIKVNVHLEMMNQRGEYNHYMCNGVIKYSKASREKYELIGMTNEFYPLTELGYNAHKDTEYLKNNTINYRLWLKVD